MKENRDRLFLTIAIDRFVDRKKKLEQIWNSYEGPNGNERNGEKRNERVERDFIFRNACYGFEESWNVIT